MNLIVFATVIYVLVAIAMIVLILMQRGSGAQAGSGFGAGASATVFGASGSANFLSKSTKWLAIVFFSMSLGMAWYASRHGGRLMPADIEDVGVLGGLAPAPSSVEATPAAEAAPAEPADEAVAPLTDSDAAPENPVQENPPKGESGG